MNESISLIIMLACCCGHVVWYYGSGSFLEVTSLYLFIFYIYIYEIFLFLFKVLKQSTVNVWKWHDYLKFSHCFRIHQIYNFDPVYTW